MGLRSGIRDPGSGKNLFRIPDPGVRKAPDHGSRIRIRNTESVNCLISFPRRAEFESDSSD
jgi:hypothetical protein